MFLGVSVPMRFERGNYELSMETLDYGVRGTNLFFTKSTLFVQASGVQHTAGGHHRLTRISPLCYRGGIGSYQSRKVVPLQVEVLLPLVLGGEGAQRQVPPQHLVVVALAGDRHLRADLAHPPVRLQVVADRDGVLQHDAGRRGRGHGPDADNLPQKRRHHEEPPHGPDDREVEEDPGDEDRPLGPDSIEKNLASILAGHIA